MRDFIRGIFIMLLTITGYITLLVGLLWLFDFKPNNLYLVWEVGYRSLAVSFLLYLCLLIFNAAKK
jgi:hypothetical protein